MSRIAAVAARVEEIVAAIAPEHTRLAGAAKFVRSDKPLLADSAPRTFHVALTGDSSWTGELAQDREGSILEETLQVTVAYRAGENAREVRDAIRADALRIQYELMHPDNWLDDAAYKCQRRTFRAFSAEQRGDGAGAQIILTVPVTLTYRPF